MSSSDPERVAEALGWWESAVYMEFTEAEEDHVRELADAARSWLAGSSPDYEAAAKAIETEVKKWPMTPNYVGPGVYQLGASMDQLARAAVDAAFPGLFKERP